MKTYLIAAIAITAAALARAAPSPQTSSPSNPCSKIKCAAGYTCKLGADGSSAACVTKAEQQCGSKVTCGHGTRCCNPLYGICTGPDELCIQDTGNVGDAAAAAATAPSVSAAAAAASLAEDGSGGANSTIPCGPNSCSGDEVCCNASCGTCTPPGGSCTLQFCPPGAGPQCGVRGGTCPFGTVCCNSSCGICTAPGGVCTTQFCTN